MNYKNMFKTSPHVSCWKLLFETYGLTAIPIYYIQDAYKSIPKRLKQVINAKSCLTKY